MTRIGIFNASFSPPSKGDLIAARAFMEQMWLDILYVIPTARHADQNEMSASDRDRYTMCQLTFGGEEGVYVSDMQLRSEKEIELIDILTELSGADRRLFLLTDTDRMLSLGDRRDARELFRLCYPTYVRTDSDPIITARIAAKNTEYQKRFEKIVRRIVTEPFAFSKKAIRDACKTGNIKNGMLLPAVEKYILDKHLYLDLPNGEDA